MRSNSWEEVEKDFEQIHKLYSFYYFINNSKKNSSYLNPREVQSLDKIKKEIYSITLKKQDLSFLNNIDLLNIKSSADLKYKFDLIEKELKLRYLYNLDLKQEDVYASVKPCKDISFTDQVFLCFLSPDADLQDLFDFATKNVLCEKLKEIIKDFPQLEKKANFHIYDEIAIKLRDTFWDTYIVTNKSTSSLNYRYRVMKVLSIDNPIKILIEDIALRWVQIKEIDGEEKFIFSESYQAPWDELIDIEEESLQDKYRKKEGYFGNAMLRWLRKIMV